MYVLVCMRQCVCLSVHVSVYCVCMSQFMLYCLVQYVMPFYLLFVNTNEYFGK